MEQLYFTEEHKMLRDMIRDFARNEVKPLAQELDEKGGFPHESVKKMAELGLMGIPWDEKYGGTGMDTMALVIAIEEIGKVCPSTSATMMAHTSLGTAPIAVFGTEEQKERYLPGLASGKQIGAFGLTEPNAGSDAGNTQTRAILNGNDFINRKNLLQDFVPGLFIHCCRRHRYKANLMVPRQFPKGRLNSLPIREKVCLHRKNCFNH